MVTPFGVHSFITSLYVGGNLRAHHNLTPGGENQEGVEIYRIKVLGFGAMGWGCES